MDWRVPSKQDSAGRVHRAVGQPKNDAADREGGEECREQRDQRRRCHQQHPLVQADAAPAAEQPRRHE